MKTRTLNGYILIYMPEHPRSMKSKTWNGFIYEHIVVSESDINRFLEPNEEVHHLDLDRGNNCPSNLIVMDKKAHRKLHKWIESGMPLAKKVNITRTMKEFKRCLVCEKPLDKKKHKYCSNECRNSDKKSILDGVEIELIVQKIKETNVESTARSYGITGNGLRKWAYGNFKIKL